MKRCFWVNLRNATYVKYHDEEWGEALHEDRELYEQLVLESFQAGLSWECILNKRENFRRAFDNFDIEKVVKYGDEKKQLLLSDSTIIRNRRKIEASINNSIVFKQIQKKYGSFDKYIWKFTGGKVIKEDYTRRTTSPLSDEISKDLRKWGMKFVGSTTIYAYLQSIGVINGHGKECDKGKGHE